MRQTITWNTSDHHNEPRHSDWYWAVGIIAVALAATAILLGNLVFGVFIIVSAFALISFNFRPDVVIPCEINDREVVIGNNVYPYGNIKAFWIDTDGHRNKLLLHTHKPNRLEVIVDIEDVDTNVIRRSLLLHIEEEKMSEPLSHVLLEKLGF